MGVQPRSWEAAARLSSWNSCVWECSRSARRSMRARIWREISWGAAISGESRPANGWTLRSLRREDMMDEARFREALQYALELHGRQTMKERGTPYMAHLLGVASITM